MFRFFENLIDPYQSYPEDPRPPRQLRAFLWSYLKPFKSIFWIAGLLSLVVAAIEILLIAYMGRLVTLMEVTDRSTFWADHGLELGVVAFAILFLRPILQGVDTMIMNNTLMPNIGTLVRYRAHRHVQGQSIGWFERDFAGRIANRIMQTPPAAGEVVFQIFDALTFSVAYLVGAAILLADADGRLVLPLIAWSGLFLALVYWTVTRVGPASETSSDARSAVTGRVVDTYTNIHSVKLFAHHTKEIDYVTESIEHARTTFQREMRLYTLMDWGLVALNGLLVVGVVGWAIYLWSVDQATLGIVAAASALVLRLNAMTGWIMWAATSFFRELGVVAEGMRTIADPITLLDAPNATPLNLSNGRITIDGLVHHYGRETGGLNNLSLTIEAAQKVGIVGRSGAGKSTLIKLLLRFYDPEGGRIEIDGQDITTVTQESLRRHIGVVQQDSSLLHRSIRDNILFGRPDATTQQMISAAQKAKAHPFIADLADEEGRSGYDAQVGERGVKLSGGQRQRISLARVILKDAPILVLDEATAALDSEVEAEIQNTLYDVMAGKTVIAIAHRLSTIAHMDRIIVLDEGAIVEDGTHSELLAQGGVYAGFWARQSGGFLDTDGTP